MAQEAVRPATVVTAIALCLSPLYNWILIFKLGCGVYGAAYALDLTQVGLTRSCLTAEGRVVQLNGRESCATSLLPVSTWAGGLRPGSDTGACRRHGKGRGEPRSAGTVVISQFSISGPVCVRQALPHGSALLCPAAVRCWGTL